VLYETTQYKQLLGEHYCVNIPRIMQLPAESQEATPPPQVKYLITNTSLIFFDAQRNILDTNSYYCHIQIILIKISA
jgi:hypothetical protein